MNQLSREIVDTWVSLANQSELRDWSESDFTPDDINQSFDRVRAGKEPRTPLDKCAKDIYELWTEKGLLE
jgi:hypothetical protein